MRYISRQWVSYNIRVIIIYDNTIPHTIVNVNNSSQNFDKHAHNIFHFMNSVMVTECSVWDGIYVFSLIKIDEPHPLFKLIKTCNGDNCSFKMHQQVIY